MFSMRSLKEAVSEYRGQENLWLNLSIKSFLEWVIKDEEIYIVRIYFGEKFFTIYFSETSYIYFQVLYCIRKVIFTFSYNLGD